MVRLRPKTRVTSAGAAEVATSKSLAGSLRKRSRTAPPTSQASKPASRSFWHNATTSSGTVSWTLEVLGAVMAITGLEGRNGARAEAIGDLAGALAERGRAVGVAAL